MKKLPLRLLLAAIALAGAIAATQLAATSAENPTVTPPPYQPPAREKDGLLSASGLVEAVAENTLVGVPFAGLVAEVPVKVSQLVKAGDPLLVLDTRELRPAAAAATASALRAEDQARRLRSLAGTGAVTERAIADAALTDCPKCGGELRKQFGNLGVSFKGSGFYKTDSAKPASSSSD
jgi:multidrug efflux pump subunit AcrA (membrane-fusion protein)